MNDSKGKEVVLNAQNDDEIMDDGKDDSICSLKWFLYFIIDLILCVYFNYILKKSSGGMEYGIGFSFLFVVFLTISCSIVCLDLGRIAVTKYIKYCNFKSGFRKVLNILNIISLFLMFLFICFVIFIVVIFFGRLIF